ncbi:virulence factor [uncultured Planktomarina sp.]|jgi:hypothetical protein|uniref:virulence factor n=1 Tax=uncultured Planktomarina sp. TaxID=1538529 RepID=UPI003261B2A7
MADVIVVYWRDIPAQVIVGKGRKASKVQLPERFEQAIDRAAMKVGAEDTDAYLAEWRKAEPYVVDGDQAEMAQAEAARLDAEYDQEKIKQLIANDGWAIQA